jgi:parallel beta-helix repeat protein
MEGNLMRDNRVLFIAMIAILIIISVESKNKTGTALNNIQQNKFHWFADYIEHSPIEILSDEDFETQGWSGSGTSIDPYIIQGLIINGSGDYSSAGVYIKDTQVHFIVRDCFLYNVWNLMQPERGVFLHSVSNALIENCSFAGDEARDGIRLHESQSVTVCNCSLYNCSTTGISMTGADSQNITISGNTIDGKPQSIYDSIGIRATDIYDKNLKIIGNVIKNCEGIVVDARDNTLIANNTCIGHDKWNYGIRIDGSGIIVNNTCTVCSRGIYLDGRESIVMNNTVWNNSYGIYGVSTLGNFILSNTINNNTYGIFLEKTLIRPEPWNNGNMLSNNTILENYVGLYLYESVNNSITRNAFINNTFNALNDGIANLFDYNYWSDYVGVDEDCNGIGDTPYIYEFGNVRDDNPLMHPLGLVPSPPTTTTTTTSITTTTGPTSTTTPTIETTTNTSTTPDADSDFIFISTTSGFVAGVIGGAVTAIIVVFIITKRNNT